MGQDYQVVQKGDPADVDWVLRFAWRPTTVVDNNGFIQVVWFRRYLESYVTKRKLYWRWTVYSRKLPNSDFVLNEQFSFDVRQLRHV